MADLRRPALRVALGLALAAALLIEVQTLIGSLGAHQRRQARAAEGLRAAMQRVRAEVAARLATSDLTAALEPLALVLPEAGIEFHAARDGALLVRRGAPIPVAHWADVEALRASGPLGVFVVGPFPERPPLLLAYALFDASPRVVLRVGLPLDDAQRDFEERRAVLVGHATSLALILIVSLVALGTPRRAAGDQGAAQGALNAYETAMGHLREREQRLSHAHAQERGRLEQAMREKEALARAGELTSGLAHEVRNGLGTILGYARLIERDAALADDTRQAAAAIREECETQAGVVRRFVEYVRAEELKLGPCDLRRTLQRVVAREQRARAGATLTLAPGPEIEISADEELLERAIENVVRNARDAAGPQGCVEVALATGDAWVEVRVADDGPGLGEGGVSALRPFHSTKPGGLGLGLPLATKLVRLHGGELAFVARAPRGLDVTLRLPRSVTGGNASSAEASGGDPETHA
jgi:signal transduction histidine kinase